MRPAAPVACDGGDPADANGISQRANATVVTPSNTGPANVRRRRAEGVGRRP